MMAAVILKEQVRTWVDMYVKLQTKFYVITIMVYHENYSQLNSKISTQNS